MNEINYLLSSIKLSKSIEKIRMSLNEIKQKNPNRLDLINSMQETLDDLIEVKLMYSRLERHNLSMESVLFNFQKMAFDLKSENESLNKSNENLKKELNPYLESL